MEKCTPNYKIVLDIVRATLAIFKLPLVMANSFFKKEFHILEFYLCRHILKPFRFYRFKNKKIKDIARSIDKEANAVIGTDHDSYSGATAPEVVSGFDVCIEYLIAEKKEVRYLEIGSAKGKSMAIIGSLVKAKGAVFKGVSVDPYFDNAYIEGADQPDRFISNRGTYTAPISITSRDKAIKFWRHLGLDVKQLRKKSTDGLLTLKHENEKFDLVYIDGMHDGLMPIKDFIASLALVETGSVVILDDRHWANVHYLRKICDNTNGLKKIYENWKISCYLLFDKTSFHF